MFYAAENLTKQSVAPCVPWEYKPAEKISEQIRHDKEERQNFYRNVSTVWNFYTTIEGSNPNQRVSKKDNPPRFLHGISADYDLVISNERIAEAIKAMPIKPDWIERSLGGKHRLLWIFPRPLSVDDYDFCCYLLGQVSEWLKLELLPGLDVAAMTDPCRLLANGCDWAPTGLPSITEVQLQNFFVSGGKAFRFTAADGVNIAIDVIEKAIKEKFPNFSWPTEFAPDTQGPSFWIPESESSMSAICKPDGMFTFSAHAAKPFYSWADILGAEFIKDFNETAIAKATADIWWDEKKFWRKKKGIYLGMDQNELLNYMKVNCGLSTKPTKNGTSQIEQALNHIYNENYVTNAAPYVFRSAGMLTYQGKRRLNTYVHGLVPPAEGVHQWGPEGSFPFISGMLDNLFCPLSQKAHFLAWWKHYYLSGYNLTPTPGQVIFLMGGVGVGKTLLNRELVGRSVGGFVDAAKFIIEGGEFNFQLYEVPHWCIDDDTVSDTPQAQQRVQSALKKSVANHDFMVNKKFNNAGMTEWMGRVICTFNRDYISSRAMGPMDGSVMDKISVFRCANTPGFHFPSRPETLQRINEQLPNFLRWLLDWEPPDEVIRDNRFGYKAYQDPSMLEQAQQTSRVAPFKEVLLDLLANYFKDEPNSLEWRGTVTKLLQTMHSNPGYACVIRTMKLEQVNRYLENVQREGILNCCTETGANNTRLWIFKRVADMTPTLAPTIPPSHSSFSVCST